MLTMIGKRLMFAIPSLIGVVIVTFLLTRALPGDPAAYFAGPAANKEAVEQIRKKLGLDKPLIEQFFRYTVDLAHGDFGTSLTTGQPVATEIRNRLPASAELTLLGLLVSVVIAIPLGILAATRPGSWIDHLCRVTTTAGVSLPVFFTGLVLVYVFYFRLGWSPAPLGRLDVFYSAPPAVTGFYLIDALIARDFEVFRSALSQLILPALTLAIFSLAPIARMTRASMLAVLASDFVRTARASGLSPTTVIVTYAFRNAMLPVITTLSMVFSFLLGANVLVEKVFAWPGIGSYAVEALISSDFAPVQGFVLTMAVMYVLLNLTIDILYGVIDPQSSGLKGEGVSMSSVAPAVEPAGPARTSGLAAIFEHTRYVLGENRVTAFAFGLLIVIVFAALFGPYVVPHDPLASDTAAALKPPSAAHWFGTDQLGRDIFSRVIVATRLDTFIAVASVVLVFLMGGLAGIAGGYFGGWTDRIVGRIADTIMAFPLFVLAMGIVAALGNTVQNIIIATAIVNFPLYARVARAEANVRRDAGFVQAARLSGNGEFRILLVHILPNIMPIMIVQMSLTMGYAILNAAGLSFIGLGVRPPTAEWGIMVAEGASFMVSGEWWIALFPGLALMIAVFCFNLLGDGLRDIVDPQRRT